VGTIDPAGELRLDRGEWLRASATSGPVSVTLWQADSVAEGVWRDNLGQLAALGVLLGALAGAAGWLVASALSRPFHRLALAAEALGRGRFDLDLPTSSVPEVRALSGALARSAAQLERNLTRDQAYLSEASHQLRTPMAGMRLELDELVLRSDLHPDARDGVEQVRDQLDRLEHALDERLARAKAARGMYDDVRVSLDSLARTASDTWTEALASRRVSVQASVDGDLDLQLTPGPVEQVLDLVRADLEESARGAVTLRIHGAGEQVSLRVTAEPRRDGIAPDRPRLKSVRLMVDALAGRCVGDPVAGGLRVWLPRR
jgi:signal transduction histidine kinase